ncbi:TetR/AcrR family transcriptional regulator [Streptomyces sp. NPDC057199]|uniref:TetR/AcrR family transcriptional regulator n=1 Tax=Streptomyces sp. NPDC057199 TaxID=3346047 RepID=UPI0036386D96
MLDAAASEIRLQGLGATLNDIAAAAGVSKGGLLYHFSSKETLLLELAHSRVDYFRAGIEANLDPADHSPGRFTRAYIRAVLDPSQDKAAAMNSVCLLAQLMVDPAISAITREANEWLMAEFRADGLPDELSVFVVAAADGATATLMWGARPDLSRTHRLERRLIELTWRPEWWTSLPWEEHS